MTIRHIVMWKLASDDGSERSAHGNEIIERLNSLAARHPDLVESITVVNDTSGSATNFDVVLVSDFADFEALERYRVHKEHQDIAEYVASVTTARACVDYELAEPLN